MAAVEPERVLEFVEALADPSRRDRFIFRDGTGADGASPPNNWVSIFGGPAWTRVPDGQWYLHLFDSAQPDLNWEHPEVFADIGIPDEDSRSLAAAIEALRRHSGDF